jgi:hypothetical protein
VDCDAYERRQLSGDGGAGLKRLFEIYATGLAPGVKSVKLKVSLRVPVLTTECLLAAIPSFLFKLVSELSGKDNLQNKGLRL